MQVAYMQLAFVLFMNTFKPFLRFVYLFFLFLACQSEKNNLKALSFDSQKDSCVLYGKILNLDEVKRPISIKIMTDFNLLIVLESEESPYLARAYTLDSLKLVRKFIKHSVDSGLIEATNINYKPHSKDFIVTDAVRQCLYVFSIDSIFSKSNEVYPIKKIDLSAGLEKFHERINRPVLVNDYIVDLRTNWADTSSGIINFYRATGELISTHSLFPKKNQDYTNVEMNQIYAAGISASDDEKHIILEYYNTDILDLYDSNGNMLERVQGPHNNSPNFIKKEIQGKPFFFPTKESHFGYTGLAKMKDSVLLVLYNGDFQATGNYHSSILFKLNSRLEPLAKYSLSQPIFSFDIDWSKRIVYGLSHKPKPSVVTFKF